MTDWCRMNCKICKLCRYHRGSDGQGLLLHELLTELENASDDESIIPEVITIVPPQEDANAETDQDSDESDAEATGDFQHLPRRILLAECSTNRYVDVAEHHEENLPGPAPKRRKKVSKPNPVQQKKYGWCRSLRSVFGNIPHKDTHTKMVVAFFFLGYRCILSAGMASLQKNGCCNAVTRVSKTMLHLPSNHLRKRT